MERVAIIGNGGSGKSTLARRLGAVTGLPVVHLDVEFWRPGWVETPDEEWIPRVRELVKGDRWIMDGNFGSTRALRIAAADTVVFLDLPTHVCVWRVIHRALGEYPAGSPRRPDMAEGCEEKFDPGFIQWVYHFREQSRPRLLAELAAAGPGKEIVHLTSSRAADRWLASLASAAGANNRGSC